MKIKVKYISNFAEFTITDDGKGLSAKDIKAVALKKGLYTHEELEK